MEKKLTLHTIILILGICFCSKVYCQNINKNDKNLTVENDSLKNVFFKSCIRDAFNQKDWNTFNHCRVAHLSLARKNNDSLSLAKTLEYSGYYFQYHGERTDSAYHYYIKSALLYKQLKDSSGATRVLLNKAILRKNIHDYQGSLMQSYEALKFAFNKEKKLKRIASIYNNLGVSFNQLKDTVDAIKYHKKALEIREGLTKEPKLKIHSLNNLGKVYKDYKNYNLAIDYLYPIVKDSTIKKRFPKIYAMALDNYGHTLFLNNQVQKGFIAISQALKIREAISDKDGIIINNIHLAEYFAYKKDTLHAISCAERANKLSKEIENYRDYLVSLKMLANFSSGKQSQNLYNTYDRIKDSLVLADRRQSDRLNQFEFELDEKEKELFIKKDQLTTNRVILIAISMVAFMLILSFGVKFYNRQKLKKSFRKGFENYLIKKYGLTSQNIEFWELWITGFGQEQLSEQLFISIDAVKSRRKSLKNKINRIQKIEGDFTQTKAIRIYHDELNRYKDLS